MKTILSRLRILGASAIVILAGLTLVAGVEASEDFCIVMGNPDGDICATCRVDNCIGWHCIFADGSTTGGSGCFEQ